jgi:hypothetical protein
MKSHYTLALVPLIAIAGCVSGPQTPSDYVGRIFTQSPAEKMASCIGQVAAATPSAVTDGFIVSADAATPRRSYEITREKDQTVVVIRGPQVSGVSSTDRGAIGCAE